jgi:regulator of microtubule dynamics protein 3
LSANSYSSHDSDETALLFMKADRLFEGTDKDKQEALDLLTKKKSKLLDDANFIWRLAKATYFKSQIVGAKNKEEQKRLVYSAKDLANDALQIDEKNSNAHKWFAIALGSTNDYESVKVKIQNGYDFKIHIERAIELNPTDPTAHYLLGRWCFGVYMLSWVERRAAATLFAAPPTATVDESLDHFLEADRLKPGTWKENLLFIGKCYVQKRDYSTAVQWLEKADVLPTMGQDDEQSQQEITSLLSQYDSYRN